MRGNKQEHRGRFLVLTSTEKSKKGAVVLEDFLGMAALSFRFQYAYTLGEQGRGVLSTSLTVAETRW